MSIINHSLFHLFLIYHWFIWIVMIDLFFSKNYKIVSSLIKLLIIWFLMTWFMVRKPSISFDFQKYVEKHCSGPWWVPNEMRQHSKLQHSLLFPIWFLLTMIEKWSKNRLQKARFMFIKNGALTRNCLLYVFSMNFLSVLWKNNVRSVLFSNENKKPNHCFQIFSVTKFLRTVWTGLSLRPVHGNCQFFSEFTFTDYISIQTLILSLIRVN